MSDLTTLFTNIADSIRAKKGSSDTIIASDFPSEIANLPSSGGYSDLGYGIDVEAQTTINKGDKIIAIPNNEYVAPTLGVTQTQSSLWTVSPDNSVAIAYANGNSQIVGEGSTLVVWFRNEETGQFDTSYSLTLENYPISTKLYSSFVMNEDGTLAYGSAYTAASNVTHFDNVLFIIEIDKENKTATYRYLTVSFDNLLYGGASSSSYKVLIDSLSLDNSYVASSTGSSRGTNGVAIENYIICKAVVHVRKASDDSYYTNGNCVCVLKYDKDTHNLSLEYYSKMGEQPSFFSSQQIRGNGIKINDDEILFRMSQYLVKYNISTKEMFYGNSTGESIAPLSRNGKYFASVSGTSNITIKVWEVSFVDLTITKIYDKTLNFGGGTKRAGYVSNDGRYLLTDCSQLFDLSNDTCYSSAGLTGSNHCLPNGFFDVNDTIYLYFNSSPYSCDILSLTPGTDAEYLASKYESYTGNDSAGIYGIASEDLVVGQRGEARATNTVQQKTVTMTGSSVTIAPDNGYDTMNKVNVSLQQVTATDVNQTAGFGKVVKYIKVLPKIIFNTNACRDAISSFNSIESADIEFQSSGTYVARMFKDCSNLEYVSITNCSNVVHCNNMFENCVELEEVVGIDFTNIYEADAMFSNCSNLSTTFLNELLLKLQVSSLNNYSKTLKYIGLSQTQATTCTTLSNWQALADAGWTTGY